MANDKYAVRGLFRRVVAVERGGPGSGHFGHAGRPGEVGGSLPSGEVAEEARPSRAMGDWGEGTRFKAKPRGAFEYQSYGSYQEAAEASAHDVMVEDPTRGLYFITIVQGADYSGLPEGVDYEAETRRCLDVYDHLDSILRDPANANWLATSDRDGAWMRDRALRYAAEVAEPGTIWRDRPRMGMNIVYTNNHESAGAGSAGDWGGKVFWVPTTIPFEESALAETTSFAFGCSPVYVTIHELHHAWGSGSELDVFSTVVAADYYLNHPDLLSEGVERAMVHDLGAEYWTGTQRASGHLAEGRLESRRAMGWFYSRHSDYVNAIFARRAADVASGTDNYDRIANEWWDNQGAQERLTQWATTWNRPPESPKT